MAGIRVMVVDDSVVVRRLVTDVLAEDPEIEVVGTAVNGRFALAKVDQLRPDIVTMDVEMPEMDGIEAVRELRRRGVRLPIIMFSTLTERGAAATFDALAAGASDYVDQARQRRQRREVDGAGARAPWCRRIKALVPPRMRTGTAVPRRWPRRRRCPDPSPARPSLPSLPAPRCRSPSAGTRPAGTASLVVGCSTGGPEALSTFLRQLPAPRCRWSSSSTCPPSSPASSPPGSTAQLPSAVAEAADGDAARARAP